MQNISEVFYKMCLNEYPKKGINYKCIICLNRFQKSVGYSTSNCQHMMCLVCARNYLNSVIKDPGYKTFVKIQCGAPNCLESFKSLEIIRSVFNAEEEARWWSAALLASCFENKVTCPFENCKAVFDTAAENMKKCTFGACFECNRGFCIPCQSSWSSHKMVYHNEEEDLKTILTQAEKQEWCRCPHCGYLVQKVGGCSTIFCNCGTYFCYKCGGYSNNHDCTNRCHEMSLEKVRQIRARMFSNIQKANRAH